MAYEDAANYNKIKSMRGFPIGTIVPWSGSTETIPKGWIACNGNTLNVTTYPLLFECIGNTYGGTAGSTFSLPSLNNRAIVDIFRGHYNFLKTSSATYAATSNHPMGGLSSLPWRPQLDSTQTSDLYWNQIGAGTQTGGAGGDTGSNNNTVHTSTMDLVGVRSTLGAALTASVTGISLTDGTYGTSFNILERKLGDGHWPQHAHGITVTGSQALGHRQTGGQNSCQTPWTGNCFGSSPECPSGQYAIDYRKYSTGQNHFRCGGGSISSTSESSGNGCSGGDTLAGRSGTRLYQSSVNSTAQSFSEIIGHSHGTVNINFTSRLVAQNSFTLNTITVNNVEIDNTAGRDAATINMTSTTPSLAMIFIIRAY